MAAIKVKESPETVKIFVQIRTGKNQDKIGKRKISVEVLKYKPRGETICIHPALKEDVSPYYAYVVAHYETGMVLRGGPNREYVISAVKKLVRDTTETFWTKTIKDAKKKYGILNKLP